MQYKAFMIKYAEIGTKGKNRYIFEDILCKNINRKLKPYGDFYIRKEQGRIFVECKSDYDYEDVVNALGKVFGAVLRRSAPGNHRDKIRLTLAALVGKAAGDGQGEAAYAQAGSAGCLQLRVLGQVPDQKAFVHTVLLFRGCQPVTVQPKSS